MPLSDQEIKELFEKAKAYKKVGNYEEALKCYDQIIENVQPHPVYFMERAEIFWNLLYPRKARRDIESAIKLDPQNPSYYLIRALFTIPFVEVFSEAFWCLDIKQQLLKRITSDCKASSEKNPDNPLVWFTLMSTEILAYDWDDAISYYGSCKPFIRTREDQMIRAWLGCSALALAGDPVEALEKEPLLDNSIPISKEILQMALSLINFLLHRCYMEEYEHWKKAIDIQKLFSNHLDPVVKIQFFPLWGWHSETLDVINKELKLTPNLIDEMLIAIKYLRKHINPDISLRLYEKIKILEPSNSKVKDGMLTLKKIIEERTIKENEIENITKVLQSNPKNIEAWQKKCNLLKELLRHEETVEVYEIITSLRPDNAEPWYKKGCILADPFKRYKEALKALEKATELKPDYTDAFYEKASIHYELRLYKEALQDYETATMLNPQHGDAWFHLGNISQILHHYDRALEAYDKAMQLSSFEKEKILYQRASVHSKRGDKAECINNLTQAIEIDLFMKEAAKEDEVFKNLWDDEDFKRIVG